MYDTDDEETQRGQRPWLPPSRGAGRGRGLLAASQWSPGSTEVVGRTTLADTVPTGYGRPRGDATTCPMDESMTPHPTVTEPGYSAGRGGGGRVIRSRLPLTTRTFGDVLHPLQPVGCGASKPAKTELQQSTPDDTKALTSVAADSQLTDRRKRLSCRNRK